MKRIGGVVLALVGCGGVQEKSDDSPVVETVEPGAGPQTGGTVVTLTGRGLDFGDETPTRIIIGTSIVEATTTDDSTITFATPPGPAGTVDLVVFNGGGAVPVLEGFTYAPLPSVREIVPELAAPGTDVIVRGSGFELGNPGTVTVELGGASLENIAVVSDTVLAGTVPPLVDEPFAPVDVTVASDNGSTTLAESFRYAGPGLLGIQGVRDRNGSKNEINRGRWFYVDPVTAEARFIVASTAPISKASVTSDGTIIGVTDQLQPRRVGPLSFSDFTQTSSNALTTGSRATDILVDGPDYYEFEATTVLRRFDLASGAIETTLTLTQALAQPSCLLQNDANTLFAVGLLNGSLNTINKVNGAVTAGAILDGPATPCHSATRIGSQIFVIGWDRTRRESTLFRLDAANATVTEVGLITENGVPLPIRGIVPTPPGL